MSTSDAFCFIPAKAASTRLKKKNLLPLAGKELLYYPIARAQESGLFGEQVVLSTESDEIAAVGESYGATVPYRREEALAYDPYGVSDVLLDFLKRFPAYREYASCCILFPTAPLLNAQDVQGAFDRFKEKGFKCLMAVCETEHNAYRALRVEKGELKALFPEKLPKKGQELEKTYRINGAATWLNVQAFWEEGHYFMEPLGAYEMPRERSVDIDDKEGYEFARFLMEGARGG